MTISAAIAVLLGAVTIAPTSAPAHGASDAIITVDKPAMVHFQTSGKVAPQCEFVDHLRGPFDTAGVSGKTHCNRDLLLDSGTYKVRLQAPTSGKGKIALKAAAFTETNTPPPQLDPRRSVEQPLHPTQQASFWLRITQKELVTLRVAGRTAGAVELWRDGQWRTEVGARDLDVTPSPGQPIHEWWIQNAFEPGDYLLTVYGTAAKQWTRGTESDSLSVSYGFPTAPEERFASIVLPASGFSAFELPKGTITAVMSLPAALETPTDLALPTVGDNGGIPNEAPLQHNCRIEPRTLRPQCAAAQPDSRHLLMVRGAPGTHVDLQWFIASPQDPDGQPMELPFSVVDSGQYLTGTYELLPDTDAAPLSCQLEQRHQQPGNTMNEWWESVAQDFLEVGTKKPFQRTFNYHDQQQVWFEVKDAGQYRISTMGDFPTRCTLVAEGSSEPLTPDASGSAACGVKLTLQPGAYELRLYGQQKGIQTLRIATADAPMGETPPKVGCLLPPTNLDAGEKYRIVTTAAPNRLRLAMVRAAPLNLASAFSVVLTPDRKVRIPLYNGGPLEVRGRGAFSCVVGHGAAESKEGVCSFADTATQDTLSLTSKEVVSVTMTRPHAPATLPPLQSYEANPAALTKLPLNHAQYFDSDSTTPRSFLFDVKDAGLYRVETQGLLATSCTVRTAVVTGLATDQGSGRGRNCLVEQYLRPGSYLVSILTTGQSRGRASVLLTQRAPRELPPVAADGEAFFAAGEGELIDQHLTVPEPKKAKKHGSSAREYKLSTTARGGANVSCRLEDKDGWPLLAVPTACDLSHSFEPGEYRWIQLPLTVESTRHTKLERVRPPAIFKGTKVHAVVFNEWSDAQLRPDGHDEYFINLRADLDLTIALTNQMQGRLYQINPDKSLKPVDVIPPSAAATPPPPPTVEGEGEGDSAGDAAPTDEADRAPPPGEGSEEEPPPDDVPPNDGEDTPTPAPAPSPQPVITLKNSLPSDGHHVHLTAGPYKLVAEHSHGDVHVRYRIFVGSDVLAPGFSRELIEPGDVTLRIPQNGTLRLKTTGEADVRCRIFDATGRLVTESSSNGDNWNCSLAEPMLAGDYKLVLEDETNQKGTTTVSVDMLDTQDAGVLTKGAALQVASSVVTASVPAVTGDLVQEIELKAATPFSCALEGPSGAILQQQLSTTSCGFLLRPSPGTYRARVWTLDNATRVDVTVATQSIETHDDGRAKAGIVARANVRAAGRYALSANALCLADAEHGLFQACGPEVSLDAGSLLIGALNGAALQNKLSEVALSVETPQEAEAVVSRRPAIQRQSASTEAIHLLRVTTPPGERAAPACGIEGGVRALLPSGCVAASRLSKDAVARWWLPSDTSVEARVTRAAAVPPSKSVSIPLGKRTLTWGGTTARYSLPADGFRLDLMLPAQAWAVLLESNGAVRDLCVADAGFERCVLSGRGGEFVVYSPDTQRAETTLLLANPVPPVELHALYEDLRAESGTLQLDIPAEGALRALDVAGAIHCLTTLADGTRLGGCSTLIPANIAARLTIEQDAGAIRAALGPPDRPEAARFGQPLPSATSSWVPWSKGVELQGTLVDRGFTLDQTAVVHLKAESGVCALVSSTTFLATEGAGASCEIHRLLTPGAYRVLVRPFGRMPLSGTLSWTTEPATPLAEGVGPEAWIAADETKFYSFATQSAGKVGFGVQVPAETLECSVLDASQHVIGTGCQQFLQLDSGSYLLAIRAPHGSPPTRFKPVLAGLAGATRDVPDDYLRDFFNRITDAQ